MIRLVASALVVVLAVPAAVSASTVPEGAELVMSPDCCCPAEEVDPDGPAEIDGRCCCELHEVPPAPLEGNPVLLAPGDLEVPAAAVVSSGDLLGARASSLASRRLANARAPPPARSLLSQHVSLLL